MQGFNMGRYHPPASLDASLSTSTNSNDRKAAVRYQPPQTVRFEMPFAIWCSTCPQATSLIGQGVRFNAHKRRVGFYFSTPIWAFRMKHTACGGWIEIRTDPKNTEYVVTEGAKRRDVGDDAAVAAREGAQLIGGTAEENEREKRRQDAFAALEGMTVDKRKVEKDSARIEEIRSLRERDWKNVDAKNALLRRSFRLGRKERERDGKRMDEIKERMGLDLEILDEVAEDRTRAELVEFGAGAGAGAEEVAVEGKPLFANRVKAKVKKATEAKDVLRQEISENSRAALNPFDVNTDLATDVRRTKPTVCIPGLKRKREDDTQSEKERMVEALDKQPAIIGLVDYNSDTD